MMKVSLVVSNTLKPLFKKGLTTRSFSSSLSSLSSLSSSSSSSNGGSGSGSSTTKAFNRQLKTIQKSNTTHHISEYSYFQQEIASRLTDRLDDILREDGFPLALDIGSGSGFLYKEICKDDGYPAGGIGGVRKLVMMDSSHDALHHHGDDNFTDEEKERCSTYKLVGDEENKLPFPDGTFDLVLSSTSMHWVNDLPGLWKEIHRVLKPDGCFLFAMIGGMTLNELNTSLNIAELERDGGVSPHVGPFVDFTDVGSLLSSAGFNLTTIDVDTVKLGYPNAMVLMEHLQRMGENNASLNRRPFVNANTFLAASCIYDQMYPLVEGGDSDDGEGQSVEATVQIIYGIGWVPHESQQKPKTRGSATHRVGDIVVDETINSTDK
jgi:NADH dehydrogenase [ubiquinone] 1 alpha subcomplex assembly factor 5